MTATTRAKMANGTYEGTFQWGRKNNLRTSVELSKNDHGWFCDSVNGQRWAYPHPLRPDEGWGYQVAKSTPLEAVRGFLRAWDDDEGEEYGCSTSASRLVIQAVPED
jgi:hypothetical protein